MQKEEAQNDTSAEGAWKGGGRGMASVMAYTKHSNPKHVEQAILLQVCSERERERERERKRERERERERERARGRERERERETETETERDRERDRDRKRERCKPVEQAILLQVCSASYRERERER